MNLDPFLDWIQAKGPYIGAGVAAVALLTAIIFALRRRRANTVGGSETAETSRRVRATARDLSPEAKELLRALQSSGRHLHIDRDLNHGRFVELLGPRGQNTDFARDDDPRFQRRYLDALEQLDDHGCLNKTHEGYYVSDHGHAVLDYLSRPFIDRLLPWR